MNYEIWTVNDGKRERLVAVVKNNDLVAINGYEILEIEARQAKKNGVILRGGGQVGDIFYSTNDVIYEGHEKFWIAFIEMLEAKGYVLELVQVEKEE